MANSRRSFSGLLCLFLAVVLVSLRRSGPGGWSWNSFRRTRSPWTRGRRNPIFSVGEKITFVVGGKPATRYEVRDYDGVAGRSGAGGRDRHAEGREPPGWYKLYVYGDTDQGEPWGRIVGGTMLRRLPPPAWLPAACAERRPRRRGRHRRPADARHHRHGAGTAVRAGREQARRGDPNSWTARSPSTGRCTFPSIPLRHRVLMVAFPNGTKDLDGVRRIVDHFQNDVAVLGAAQRAERRQQRRGLRRQGDEAVLRYGQVRQPQAQGPGAGHRRHRPAGRHAGWIEDFFKAGGGESIDAFSFHAYNAVNGDLTLARLVAGRACRPCSPSTTWQNIEKWQTEQGYFAAMYGAYQPQPPGPLDHAPDDGLRAVRHPQGTQPSLVRQEPRLLGLPDLVGERGRQCQPRRPADACLVGGTVRHATSSRRTTSALSATSSTSAACSPGPASVSPPS